jgi:hypothetical protein
MLPSPKSSEATLQLYQKNHFCLIAELPEYYIRVIFDTFSEGTHRHQSGRSAELATRWPENTAHRLIRSRGPDSNAIIWQIEVVTHTHT